MQAGREKVAVNLDDSVHRWIALGVLNLLERGEKVHDVAALTQEIVKQVWYGYQDERMEAADDASRP
ncbi:hypothetical protein [Brevibacillus sp. AY1]|uniref:hypothetical protein n=1 Tax=Brevibacillus sp. AY1 TaxID=2807621 RepID=UPI0024545CDD|nr:hypothetical protein [Brevibacillus sp. AY1]MDH4619819.1 hypothetical protein [Brevibacillus sp. AY1]